MKRWMTAIGTLLLLLAAVWQSAAVRSEIQSAGERCLTVLIPSLYGFTFLAAFCIRSGMLRLLTSHCKAGGQLWAVLLFSQIGGYPVGAQLLHEMRNQGSMTIQEERNLQCICFGCGPGFLLGTVCRGISPGLSAWMMLSLILPNLMLAPFFLRRAHAEQMPVPQESFAVQFTAAAESAASAMIKVTSMVLVFAAGMGIAEGTGALGVLPPAAGAVVRSLLEVSNIAEYLHTGGTLPLAAALLSFGGICVHTQLAAICEGNTAWCRLLLTRLAASVMTYGICRAGIALWFRDAAEVMLTQTRTQLTTGSPLPGLCLLLMAVLLLRGRW